jgi:hypothetical protein
MILVDCNCAHKVKPSDPDGAPVFERLISAKLTLCIGGRLTEELADTKLYSLLKQLRLAGRLLSLDKKEIEREELKIEKLLVSNDGHIIAIARICGCRLLFSNDKDLHIDFRNKTLIDTPRGKIYQDSSHSHLLDEACS